MAKKSLNKATKQLAPDAGAKQSGRAYPAEPEKLNGQRQRLKKAAAPAATPALHTASVAASSPPLAPLVALWPTPAPAQGASKPSQAPARKVQAGPVKAAAPHASPAPAAPPVKLSVQWQPKTLPGEQAVAEVPLAPAPLKVKVTFVVVDLGAKQVSLSGEFNGWSPNATPMRRDSSGHWETTVELAPGHYQYKFIVDGHWIPDPQAHENVWNQHGTLNSMIEVRA